MAECWSCGAERGDAAFCTTCNEIQPVSDRVDYFSTLGLERRMRQDRDAIEKGFREASRDVHPDRFGTASAVARKIALARTEKVNHAYRTLKDPQARAEYLMKLEGVDVAGEHKRTEDPAFLMEMLELQESVDQKNEDELEALHGDMKKRFDEHLGALEGHFDRGEGSREDAVRSLDELRYLKRLLDRVDAKLEEMY